MGCGKSYNTKPVNLESPYLFTGDEHGILKQWSIESGKLIKKFPSAHTSSIWCMVVSTDSKYLFTSDIQANVKQWLVFDYS